MQVSITEDLVINGTSITIGQAGTVLGSGLPS